jgi:hypothetical protein
MVMAEQRRDSKSFFMLALAWFDQAMLLRCAIGSWMMLLELNAFLSHRVLRADPLVR